MKSRSFHSILVMIIFAAIRPNFIRFIRILTSYLFRLDINITIHRHRILLDPRISGKVNKESRREMEKKKQFNN